MTNPSGNGSGNGKANGRPHFVGKDKIDRRRALLVKYLLDHVGEVPSPEALAKEFHVGIHTMKRDLASSEVISAIDESIEKFVDVVTIKKAWDNINKAIEGGNVDRSIWLIEHRSKQSRDDQVFGEYQRQLAKEFARAGSNGERDPNEEVEFDVTRPDIS